MTIADRTGIRLQSSRSPSLKAQIRALFNELTSPTAAHDVWSLIATAMPNPDKVLEAAGVTSLTFYDSMCDNDSNLSGLINTRIDAVTGLEWEIIPASDEARDEELAEFVRLQFEGVFEFANDLEELMGALRTGVSFSEIIWERQGSRIGIAAIKSRRPDRFAFDFEYRLLIKTKAAYFGELAPLNKFIVHRNRMRYENPYGVSACRAAYWPWHFKHYGFQWWLVAAERNAVPTPMAGYPQHWDADQQADLLKYLLGSQSDNALIYELGAEISHLVAKTDPQLNEKLRDACNEEMAWAIIGSTHATGTGAKGGGSYALAREHGTVRQDILERDCVRLGSTVNNQLVIPLILLNFPEPPIGYPRFKLKFEPPADRKLESEITEIAVKMGLPVDELIAAEKMGVTLAEGGRKAIEAPAPASPFGSDGEGEPLGEFEEGRIHPVTVRLQKEKRPILHGVRRAAKRDHDTIERLENAAVTYGTSALNKTVEQLADWLDTQSSLERAAVNIDQWQFTTEPLANTLNDVIFWGYLWGYHDLFTDRRAPRLTRRVKGVLGIMHTVQLPIQLQDATFGPVKPEEAIKAFEKREVLTRDQFDQLQDFARQEAFTAAGTTLDTLQTQIRPTIMRALEEGMSLGQFRNQVGELLLSPAHAETVFRTNIQTAYNTGHADAMFDPLVADLIPAVQFVAVIDSRTTDICESMNGQIFRKDDLLGAQFTPPLHYNCRSVIEPVFSDEFKDVKADQLFSPADMRRLPEAAQPLPGFGYFHPILNTG